MEAFAYVDIFATKGIEYLLVIDFLLIFVLFWRVLSTATEEGQEAGVQVEYEGREDEIQRGREFTRFAGPQWTWKWEILRV